MMGSMFTIGTMRILRTSCRLAVNLTAAAVMPHGTPEVLDGERTTTTRCPRITPADVLRRSGREDSVVDSLRIPAERQHDAHHRAPFRRGVHRELAAVGGDDSGDDGQAQA